MFDDSLSSEWNEQQAFSEIFFDIERECRLCQRIMDYHGWYRTALSKISLIMSVAKKDDIDKLNKLKTQLKTQFNFRVNLEHTSLNYNCPSKEMVEKRKELLRTTPTKDDILFEVDSQVNQIANAYMPFLNKKKKFDIAGI